MSCTGPAFLLSAITTLGYSRKLNEMRYLPRMLMKWIPAPPYRISAGSSSIRHSSMLATSTTHVKMPNLSFRDSGVMRIVRVL